MRLPDGRVRKFRRSSEDPGCAHELTFLCYRGLPLLGRDRTRRWFVNALAQTRARHDLELWTYVIMPEHAHGLSGKRRRDVPGAYRYWLNGPSHRSVLRFRVWTVLMIVLGFIVGVSFWIELLGAVIWWGISLLVIPYFILFWRSYWIVGKSQA